VRYVSAVLEQRERGGELSLVFAELLAQYLVGHSALPTRLGLSEEDYQTLWKALFGSAALAEVEALVWASPALNGAAESALSRAQLRDELATARESEVDDLVHLLVGHADPEQPLASFVARTIAVGCLGSAHLYRDLGFSERGTLRRLLESCFPRLVQLNTEDMRWKRFFYRKLCENGGDYVCRAPSCHECSSRSECFDTSSQQPQETDH
jgi:nitrogen fixation protein NifQ